MITITQALIVEHAAFLAVFDQIESLLPTVRTANELKILARLMERLLQDHGETEKNLVYVALDHVLEDKGQLDRLHQEHEEMDARLREVQARHDVAEARQLLKAALRATRDHFRYEEEDVFPLIERAMQGDTLAALGSAHVRQHEMVTN